MSKWVEVTAEIVYHYMVEVTDEQSEEEAQTIVANELMHDFNTITSNVISEGDVYSYTMHTDKDKILGL